MELGAMRCSVTAPACQGCPLSATCAWLAAGRPAGPPRRPAQRWQGTDRQIRGEIMAVLRASRTPVSEHELLAGRGDLERRRRCLGSLIEVGLAVRSGRRRYALPD
jgi:A/G-specific adenine glycosylase